MCTKNGLTIWTRLYYFCNSIWIDWGAFNNIFKNRSGDSTWRFSWTFQKTTHSSNLWLLYICAEHRGQCTTRFQLLTTASENRNVWEQCYDDERSYLRQMSKRAWITALTLFGLFFRNSHATVFYKKRQTLQECSRLHFTIIVINVTSCLMANVETPLSCCGKWYIDIVQSISLSYTPAHCMISYTLKPMTHLQSYLSSAVFKSKRHSSVLF